MNNKKEQILEIIRKAVSKRGLTNCMLSFAEIKTRIEQDRLIKISDKPLVLLENFEKYYQLYYFLENPDLSSIDFKTINESLAKFSPLYADITLKGDFQYKDSFFEKLDMSFYRTYIRKSVINKEQKNRKLMDADYASLKDSEEIYRMLCNQFDLMSDHIPSKPELDELLKNGNVLKITIKDAIAGVLLFEDYGKRAYARALCVSPDYQNSFVGYSLMADYFSRHNAEKTSLFYLWVDEANQNVEKLHNKFGYQFDGLKNYIFRRP